MKTAAVVAGLLVVGLGLGGCARTPPTAGGTPGAASPVAANPEPATTPAGPGPSVSPSPTPSASALVLAGDGLGGLPFGTAEATTMALLTERLGKPTTTASGRSCELDSTSPWARTVVYRNFWVEFEAKDSRKSSPRTLTGWGYHLKGALPSALSIEVPLDLGFKQLKARYPGTQTLKLGLEDGTVAVRLPDKLIFYGVKVPEVVRGGDIQLCE